MSILSRIPFFTLRYPLCWALTMAFLLLSAASAVNMGTPRSGPQAERILAKEKKEAERRQEILRQCLDEGKEVKKQATATFQFAPEPSLTWRAVAPSEGLTPAEPLTRLADDVALAMTWSDTKPEDTAYEGLVALLAPSDRYLGLMSDEEVASYFLSCAFEELDCSPASWKRKDGSGICLRETAVKSSSGETKAVQAVAVTVIHDMPVFWFAQRFSRGDAAQEEEGVESALRAQINNLSTSFWQKYVIAEIVHAFCDPVLLLSALLIGWCFALEFGFASLCAMLLSSMWTLLSLALDLSGLPVSVSSPFVLAACANSLVALAVTTLAGFLHRRMSGDVLEARLLARENELAIQLLRERDGAQDELQKRRTGKKLAAVQDRSLRNRRYVLAAIFLLACVLLECVLLQKAWESERSFRGMEQSIEALTQRHPGR